MQGKDFDKELRKILVESLRVKSETIDYIEQQAATTVHFYNSLVLNGMKENHAVCISAEWMKGTFLNSK